MGRHAFGTTHGKSGNVFANPDASSSAPLSSIYLWNESQNEFGAKVTVIKSVTANAVYCHRRVV